MNDYAQTKLFIQHLSAGNTNKFIGATEGLNDPVLNALHSFYSDNPIVLNDELGSVLRGWQYYYKAQYSEAIDHFNSSLELGKEWESWALLGLGKVSSDYLSFDKALCYLRESLRLARAQNDFVRMSEAYGALAELAFRAGDYLLAYELISLDNALLVPGSDQEFRLNNYQAICAGRLGHFSWANMQLKGNYFASRYSDPKSSDYSLASQFVSTLLQGQSLDSLNNIMEKHQFLTSSTLAKGSIQLCLAWESIDKEEEAIVHLDQAIVEFTELYPVEQEYSLAVKALLMNKEPELERWFDLAKRDAHLSPPVIADSVLDDFIQIPNIVNYYAKVQAAVEAKDLTQLRSFIEHFFI